MTPEREAKLGEMAKRRCKIQREAMEAAGLNPVDANILMIVLTQFIDISTNVILSLPVHLRNLTMKLFLGEQEAVKSAQDTHGHLSPEIMPQLEEIALAQMKNQEELLARENVVGEERERVNLALLMLNSWMMGMIGSMPSPMVSLFGKLSLDQFRELIEVYDGRQN